MISLQLDEIQAVPLLDILPAITRNSTFVHPKEDAKALNVYLYVIKSKAHEVRTQLIQKNLPITSIAIKDALSGTAERRKMFIAIAFIRSLNLFNVHNKGRIPL